MTRKSRRELEREVNDLSESNEGRRNERLRQNIPTELIEEWAEFSGRDMEWVESLK